MELDLQILFGLHVHSCTHWLRPRTPPPRIWAHIRGRYWSAKIDDISLWPHDSEFLAGRLTCVKLTTIGQLKWPPLVGHTFVSSSLIGPFDVSCMLQLRFQKFWKKVAVIFTTRGEDLSDLRHWFILNLSQDGYFFGRSKSSNEYFLFMQWWFPSPFKNFSACYSKQK